MKRPIDALAILTTLYCVLLVVAVATLFILAITNLATLTCK